MLAEKGKQMLTDFPLNGDTQCPLMLKANALDTGITWSPEVQPALPISIWPFCGPRPLPDVPCLVTGPCSLHLWPSFPNKAISHTGLGAIPLEYDFILKNVIAIFSQIWSFPHWGLKPQHFCLRDTRLTASMPARQGLENHLQKL